MDDNITLNSDQCQALEEIIKFLNSSDKTVLTLSGVAGTGKTTLLRHLLSEISGKRMMAMTAPTNKAVKVIRDMVSSLNIGVKCFTTYSLFNLRVSKDNKLKTVNYEKGRQVENDSLALQGFDTVVIDEASMVSTSLFKYLVNYSRDHNLMYKSNRKNALKYIFVGDPLQLPPVNEDSALPFSNNDQLVNLNTVVRQSLDNPIIKLTENIRNSILNKSILKLSSEFNEAGNGVKIMNKKIWDRSLMTSYTKSDYVKEQKCYRVVAYRNAIVDNLNRSIRSWLYGDNVQSSFVIGERVLAHVPVFNPKDVDRMLLHTDEEAVISAISVCNHIIHQGVMCWKYDLLLESEIKTGKAISVYCVHPDGERNYLKLLNKIVESKNWKMKNEFEDSFAKLRPVHAVTSHKSQGSTFQKVFVDADDILSIPDKKLALRSLYVAVSRASKKVAIKYSGVNKLR